MVVVKISENKAGLGSEHPHCDQIQLIMLILFFVVWGIDTFSFFILNYSTVLGGILYLPLRVFLAIVTFCFGSYLAAKSHTAVFGEVTDKPKLIDTDVYSRVRHPMYLGILLFCLAFFIAMPSLISLAVWIAFFIFYDQMATYEEKDLIRILGEKYIAYQKLVPKWFPHIRLRD
jgi:protein-S-isoprenylcysteine O-methyltransferase Ste14